MDVIAFGSDALEIIDALEDENAAYWRYFLQAGAASVAANFQVYCGLVQVNGRLWPLSVHDPEALNSYPCSLHTQYIRYPLAEIGLVPDRIARKAIGFSLSVLDVLLQAAGVDRTVQWSSWLLSTNLHEHSLAEDAPAVTTLLCQQFPEHAILVRNVHAIEQADLLQKLEACGYQLWTSRRVYLFDGKAGDFQTKSTVRRDAKAFKALRDYHIVEHEAFTPEDAPRIIELYRMLYLDKHSVLNPQYTTAFVKEALKNRLLEFRGLRHVSGRLDGVFACFSRGNVTSTPFIGYDTTLGSELGLYRHLVTMLLARVSERQQLLNYSSGAGEFKRRRGGQPVIEYNAVYTRHLSPVRRLALNVFGRVLNHFGKRFLEEHNV